MRYRKLALGGTFQCLHSGHKALLKRGFQLGDEVTIGLMADEVAKEYLKPHKVEAYDKRKTELMGFLIEEGFSDRAHITHLYDAYGPAISSRQIEALVVSEEKQPIAERINQIRKEKGLKQLDIVAIKMILAEDGKPISTTRILRREIDTEGHLLKA